MYAGCRCPRCADAILESKTLEGCEALACRRCGGAFVGAGLGLRLLAVLEPDVPPHDRDVPRSPCPVCRTSMKVVQATRAETQVDTCAKHGVWFDGGDLGPVVRAVAIAMGKPVPRVAAALDEHTASQRPRPRPAPSSSSTRETAPRWSPEPTGSTPYHHGARSRAPGSPARSPTAPPSRPTPAGRAISGAGDLATGLGDVLQTPLEIIAFPFELTLATVGLLTELVD